MEGLADLKGELAALEERLETVQRSWSVADYEALLGFYVEILPRVMGAERCGIFFVDLRRKNIWLKVGTGLKPREIEAPLEGSFVGRSVSTGRTLVKNDLDRAAGFHEKADAQTGFITRSLICTPVKSRLGPQATAAVELLNKVGDAGFDQEDMELLERVASYLSMVIDNIRLNDEILHVSKAINAELRSLNPGWTASAGIIAESPAMTEVLEFARSVAETPVSVFISGENGVGKEVIARLIHALSPARDKPFVTVNCASIPDNLMESEFFGYEKGAFTGALTSRKGRFEEADGGTLFLDEIADLPLAMQPKFLRVLQEGECVRLGSNQVRKFEFRILSATNKDIRKEVAEERFREDLFYRLFSVDVHIPPLRERVEDILPLARAFLKETSRRFKRRMRGFSPEVIALFESYDWPGNVRQMRREVERLVTLTREGEEMAVAHCSQELRQGGGADKSPAEGGSGEGSWTVTDEPLKEQVQNFERCCIAAALKRSKGNKGEAARMLGITRQWLHRKMTQHGL